MSFERQATLPLPLSVGGCRGRVWQEQWIRLDIGGSRAGDRTGAPTSGLNAVSVLNETPRQAIQEWRRHVNVDGQRCGVGTKDLSVRLPVGRVFLQEFLSVDLRSLGG